MGRAFLLSLLAALNPTLLGATTVMLLLSNPGRLMLGYLLGAMMTSVILGVVIVFSLESSSVVNDTQNTINPAIEIALGVIALVMARVLGPHHRGGAPPPAKAKAPPRWQTRLSRSSPRGAFVVGALLTLPGASYLAGLRQIAGLNYSDAATVLLVIGFNLVMLMLLELPLLGFAVAPAWTKREVATAKSFVARHGRKVATYALAGIGVALVVKGVVALIAA